MKPILFLALLVPLVLIGCSHDVANERGAGTILPHLTDPATSQWVPGKFVWIDLFTSDFEDARDFYAELFGWEWRWVSKRRGHRYGMFYAADVAMAGIAETEKQDDGKSYARWIYYISVEDIGKAISDVEAAGGKTLLAERKIPDRGVMAVVADREDAPFGLLHSSSGDPADYRAEVGQWLWLGLFARDAKAASEFYASIFGYEVHENHESSDVVDFVLAAGGYSRAGIGQMSPESESDPAWLGFVRVETLATTFEKVKALGGQVLYDPENEMDRIGIIEDPFGAPLGVMPWSFEDADESTEEAGQ